MPAPTPSLAWKVYLWNLWQV